MLCPQCRTEFIGWRGKCPDCKVLLVDQLSPELGSVEKTLPYNDLVDLVKKNSGQISIDLIPAEVERQKKWGFPFLGYGYAWVKRLRGVSNGFLVELTTTETGRQKKWSFPYFAFGFAWEKTMQGSIAGNELTLTATKVSRKRKWDFPWVGFGFAWTEEMTGECGADLTVRLTITDVNKKRSRDFLYFGYGYAWAGRGDLELKLIE
ncbi:MAG: hypothetical protein MUO67_07215 [Anaerolineales bacterium]|nr:hypothetical protein [Anaerolineales bacterium]